jgi:hypothetical protein
MKTGGLHSFFFSSVGRKMSSSSSTKTTVKAGSGVHKTTAGGSAKNQKAKKVKKPPLMELRKVTMRNIDHAAGNLSVCKVAAPLKRAVHRYHLKDIAIRANEFRRAERRTTLTEAHVRAALASKGRIVIGRKD